LPPTGLSVLFATNFSNHYLTNTRAIAAEWGSVVSLFPEHGVEPRIVEAVTRAVETYHRVPPEV
jgi:hypothetical protein